MNLSQKLIKMIKNGKTNTRWLYMVLVFFICTAIILIIACMIVLSTIKIELQHFETSNMREEKNRFAEGFFSNLDKNVKMNINASTKVSQNYKLKISFNLLDKLKWIGICLNGKKIEKLSRKIKWKSIDFKKIEQSFEIEDLKQLKKIQPKLSYFHLEGKIGLEDAITTSFFVAIISAVISILIPHVAKKYEENKYQYKIVPLYINKNVYKIKFDCIIEIKMVHIINILYYFLKKRRGENHEQRASNRRSYGYSYE